MASCKHILYINYENWLKNNFQLHSWYFPINKHRPIFKTVVINGLCVEANIYYMIFLKLQLSDGFRERLRNPRYVFYIIFSVILINYDLCEKIIVSRCLLLLYGFPIFLRFYCSLLFKYTFSNLLFSGHFLYSYMWG